jgi:glutaredoxin
MTNEIIIYSRKDCCLCEEMKAVISQVGRCHPLTMREIDIDTCGELQAQFGSEVPVLFINGRKAFKYRVTPSELAKRLRRERLIS